MTRRSEERIDRGRRDFLRGRPFRPGARGGAGRRNPPLGPLAPAPIMACTRGNPCVDCEAPCVAACEPGIIRLHPDGHTLAGVPYLSFEKSGCTFCNDCVQRCPATTEEELRPTKLGLALLDRAACVAWDGVVCTSCQTACPYQAVVMDGGVRPSIDAEACNGCGFCVGVCPTEAIRISW